MAIDPQNRKNVDDTTNYIQDTLLSVSAKVGEALREAVNEAFDGADATVIKSVGNDLTRSFKAAAKFSDTIAQNNYKINQGLLSSKDIEKQKQDLELKRSEIFRKYLLARQLGIEYSLEDKQAALESLDTQKKLLENDEKRVKNMEKNMGAMGEVFSRLSKNKFFGSLLNAEQGLIAMRKEAAKNVTGFKLLGAGIKAAFAGIEKATVILFLINQAVKVFRFFKDLAFGASTAIASLAKNMGTSMEGGRALYKQLYDIRNASGGTLFNIQRTSEALKQVNSEFGYARQISDDLIKTQVRLTERVGASAAAAANFNLSVVATGENADVAYERMVNLSRSMQEIDGIGVDVRTVVEDIAAAGSDVASYFGYSTDALAEAAINTRKLGLSLTQAKNVAEGLLDFESSISAQLELSVLTQKQFNFGNAMAKAAMGDIAGATQDVIQQMNQLTREQRQSPIILRAMAQAAGISTEELSRQFALQTDITAQRAEYNRIREQEGLIAARQFLVDKGIQQSTVEDIDKRVDASEKFNEALIAAKDAFSQLVSGGLLDRLMSSLDRLVALLDDFIYRAQQTSVLRAAFGGGYSREEQATRYVESVDAAVGAYNLQSDKSVGLNKAVAELARKDNLTQETLQEFVRQTDADVEKIKEIVAFRSTPGQVSARSQKQYEAISLEMLKTAKQQNEYLAELAKNSSNPGSVNINGNVAGNYIRQAKTSKRANSSLTQ